MDKTRAKVKDFLRQNRMDEADISMQQVCDLFTDEMNRGLAGHKSSLAMLATYIETERQVPCNEPVIVMDAGGTNFRVATVWFRDDGKPVIEDFKLYKMPGIDAEVGRREFFRTMAQYVDHVVHRSAKVGFCFSYPLEMSPSKDGKVLYFSKEIKAAEVVGQMLGENLNRAIAAVHPGK